MTVSEDSQNSRQRRRGVVVVPAIVVLCVLVLFLLVVVSLDEQVISLRSVGSYYTTTTDKGVSNVKNETKRSDDENIDDTTASVVVVGDGTEDSVAPSFSPSAQAIGDDGNGTIINDSSETLLNNETNATMDTLTGVGYYDMNNATNDHNATSTAVPPPVANNATLLVALGGELGNHLQIFAMARVVQLLAFELHNISSSFVLHHQNAGKWKQAAQNIQKCFPRFRPYNFEAANNKDFEEVLKGAQTEWLGTENASALVIPHESEKEILLDSVQYWKTLLDGHHDETPPGVNLTKPSPVSMPFLYVQGYIPLSLVDEYLDEIRDLFEFDFDACCRLRPDPDETVLHIRNFIKEMPRAAMRLGFEELSPNKTAYELLGHLQEGDKVAVLTRFSANDVAAHTEAMQERGLQVRVISGQSDVQDFCFLLETQKELVGVYQSTFSRWAAYLGRNITKARLYFINSPSRRGRFGDDGWYKEINWTNPLLKHRVSLERYQSEAQDAQDRDPKVARWLRRWLL